MNVYKINDLFSTAELEIFYDLINSIVIPIGADGKYIYDTDEAQKHYSVSKHLGRFQYTYSVPIEVSNKLLSVAQNIDSKELILSSMTYVEYNKKYGTPNLPPHLDGDNSDVIVNYQLSSNTSWGIGLETELYTLEDNSALVFNPNKNIHWRPEKIFNEDEYVKMIFFRLKSVEDSIDNSHLRYSIDDPIFEETKI
jgi:hypothetical protein